MSKTKKPKKHYPTDIPLAENVRLLKCGAWGYILNGKPVFKSIDVKAVNAFSEWVTIIVTHEGDYLQTLEETKVLPKCHLCDTPHWSGGGNNFESQTKIPKG